MSKIRIHQCQFVFPDRFSAGHQLSASEASALNSLRSENIRNNVAKFVNEELAKWPEGAVLSSALHERLQQRVEDYARDYEFSSRAWAPPPSAVELEARELARERIRERFGEAEGDGFESAVAREELLPELIALARQRVAIRQRTAARALEELI